MREGGHWSKPGAWRTWDALMELGGRGTTREIRSITDSEAVHSDVHGLRCLLQFDYGYDPADTLAAVSCEMTRTTDAGKRVMRYTLRDDVRALHRRVRDDWPHEPNQGPPAERAQRVIRRATQALMFGQDDYATRMRRAGL